jgi:hypothetical protein
MKKAIFGFMKAVGISLGLLLACFAIIITYWAFRTNAAQVEPALGAEVWTAVSDGMHNSNTDMTYWKGNFYLVHQNSPYHMGTSDAKLVVRRSADAKNWTVIKEINVPGEDIRDPKFGIIRGRLLIYVLKNIGFEPEPYGTAVTYTSDGTSWSRLSDLKPEGWLFWRPKTRDGKVWYTTAYWKHHGKSILLKTTDGLTWEIVSAIHEGDRNDETDMEFLKDGRILATARLEGDRSWHQGSMDAKTLIGISSPPYKKWETRYSTLTRLDGPVLFPYRDRVFAVARFDPEGYTKWYGMSSLLGRKRTSIYEVTPAGLARLSDLPSAGDTSYPGIVMKDGFLYISYYTSETKRDYPWLLGLIMPSDIKMARLRPENLLKLADMKKTDPGATGLR